MKITAKKNLFGEKADKILNKVGLIEVREYCNINNITVKGDKKSITVTANNNHDVKNIKFILNNYAISFFVIS